jgi:hypothetical protein
MPLGQALREYAGAANRNKLSADNCKRLPHLGVVAGCAVLLLAQATWARADEVCQFSGTSDYAGRVEVTTHAADKDGRLGLAVAVRFKAMPMVLAHIHYLAEELSAWHYGALESVAVNNRYLFDGGIVR